MTRSNLLTAAVIIFVALYAMELLMRYAGDFGIQLASQP